MPDAIMAPLSVNGGVVLVWATQGGAELLAECSLTRGIAAVLGMGDKWSARLSVLLRCRWEPDPHFAGDFIHGFRHSTRRN